MDPTSEYKASKQKRQTNPRRLQEKEYILKRKEEMRISKFSTSRFSCNNNRLPRGHGVP